MSIGWPLATAGLESTIRAKFGSLPVTVKPEQNQCAVPEPVQIASAVCPSCEVTTPAETSVSGVGKSNLTRFNCLTKPGPPTAKLSPPRSAIPKPVRPGCAGEAGG